MCRCGHFRLSLSLTTLVNSSVTLFHPLHPFSSVTHFHSLHLLSSVTHFHSLHLLSSLTHCRHCARRPGRLAQMNDALVSADPADVDAVVRKVRLWLAKKRFHAAGWAVVATNRIMQKVDGYRAFLKYVPCARSFTSPAMCALRLPPGHNMCAHVHIFVLCRLRRGTTYRQYTFCVASQQTQ